MLSFVVHQDTSQCGSGCMYHLFLGVSSIAGSVVETFAMPRRLAQSTPYSGTWAVFIMYCGPQYLFHVSVGLFCAYVAQG